MDIEKIPVNGHYVWVDKDVTLNCSVGERNGFQYDYKYDVYYYRSYKIVAASSELRLNISVVDKVPTYVEWLAENNYEATKYSPFESTKVAFIKGYQAAEKEKSDEVLTKYQEGMAKGLELCKELFTEEDLKEVLPNIKLVSPVHISMVSDGHGEFPDTYQLTKEGIDYVIEKIKRRKILVDIMEADQKDGLYN